MNKRYRTTSVAETEALAAALGRELKPGSFIALEGELGVGKTQFVRGLARGLGLDPKEVSSPTFTILQIYGEDVEDAVPLKHFDLYRLEDEADVERSGLLEDLLDPEAVVVVEWSERAKGLIPLDAWHVLISREAKLAEVVDGVLPVDDVPRVFDIKGPGVEELELDVATKLNVGPERNVDPTQDEGPAEDADPAQDANTEHDTDPRQEEQA